MKCKKCECEIFKIKIKMTCYFCEENGAEINEENDSYNGEDYIYDKEIISKLGIERTQAIESGLCNVGEAAGMGCWKAICNNCGFKTNLPFDY